MCRLTRLNGPENRNPMSKEKRSTRRGGGGGGGGGGATAETTEEIEISDGVLPPQASLAVCLLFRIRLNARGGFLALLIRVRSNFADIATKVNKKQH